MQKTVDEEHFQYVGTDCRDGYCHLRVWEQPGQNPVAVITEPHANTGMSITKAAEMVWPLVWQFLERPTALMMIEHYVRPQSGRSGKMQETFDLVTFSGPGRFESPTWRRLHRVEVDMLIGGGSL